MTRVALLVEDPSGADAVRKALGDDGFRRYAGTSTWRQGEAPEVTAKELAASGADVVVLALPSVTDVAMRIAGAIDQSHPEIAVVVVADPSPDVWREALQAGVRDVLPVDATPSRWREVVERALHVADVRRSNIIDLRDGAAVEHTGRIITVVSPKGGAGKTTVATNLAVGLARRAPDSVAIVDLDLQFGDVASALQVAPDLSLADLTPGEAEEDPARVKLLLAHHPERLFALCAPDDPAAADDVSADDVGPVLRALASDLQYVVVDTCAGIDPHTLAAMEASTDLVLVGAMDVPSIRSLRKLVDALDRLGMDGPERIVVLNRSDSRVDLDIDDVATAIGLPIAVAIPSSRSVPLSVNHGCPVLLFDPRSTVIRPLQELISLLSGEPLVTSAAPRSLFRRSTR